MASPHGKQASIVSLILNPGTAFGLVVYTYYKSETSNCKLREELILLCCWDYSRGCVSLNEPGASMHYERTPGGCASNLATVSTLWRRHTVAFWYKYIKNLLDHPRIKNMTNIARRAQRPSPFSLVSLKAASKIRDVPVPGDFHHCQPSYFGGERRSLKDTVSIV